MEADRWEFQKGGKLSSTGLDDSTPSAERERKDPSEEEAGPIQTEFGRHPGYRLSFINRLVKKWVNTFHGGFYLNTG